MGSPDLPQHSFEPLVLFCGHFDGGGSIEKTRRDKMLLISETQIESANRFPPLWTEGDFWPARHSQNGHRLPQIGVVKAQTN